MIAKEEQLKTKVTTAKSIAINTFHATGVFLYSLKTLENLWFSDVFRGYRKRPVTSNGLMRATNLI